MDLTPLTYFDFDGPHSFRFGDYINDPSPWVYPTIADPWLTIPAVEPLTLLHTEEVPFRSALLAPSHFDALHAARIVSNAEGWSVDGPPVGPMPQGAQAMNEDPDPDFEKTQVRMPRDGRALYSATRNEILLVGGSNLLPESRIRRYDFATQTVDVANFDPQFAPTSLVLGAAWDHIDNKLFVLDTDGSEARLVEHDLDTGSARERWSTTYQAEYESTYLGHTENGRLVLAVTGGMSTTIWNLDLRTDQASFAGRIDIEGEAVAVPSMGEHALILPIIDGAGALRYFELAATRFEKGAPSSGL